MTEIDREVITIARLAKLLRAQGASIRAIAKAFGWSKSTTHRFLSQVEQLERLDPQFFEATNHPLVPNGTEAAQQTDA